MKEMDEHESIRQATIFEHLLITAIVIHFVVNGIEVSPENTCKAHPDVNTLADLFPFVEIPIFKRTNQYFSQYLLRFRKMIDKSDSSDRRERERR